MITSQKFGKKSTETKGNVQKCSGADIASMIISRLAMLSLLLASNLAALEMGWRPEVESAINDVIVAHENESPKPVAVFDWDNTTAKHDLSEAIFHKMLADDMMFAPENDDLLSVTHLFTRDAIAAVKSSCKRVMRKQKKGYLLAGSFYKTSGAQGKACRQEFINFYYNEKTAAGQDAFSQSAGAYNPRTIRPSYLWMMHLYSGMSRDDVHALANFVLDERTKPEAKLKSRNTVDGRQYPSFLEINQPIVTVIDKLLQSGFEVWIVSASQQYTVETFAARLNQKLGGRLFNQNINNRLETEASRKRLPVIGVQMLSDQGQSVAKRLSEMGIAYDGEGEVLVNAVRGCGGYGENEIITYIEGKPCFINLAIGKRPVLAFGDANTDVGMLQQASELSVAINRNYSELMCNAYQKNAFGKKKWVVQPMFIDPCKKRDQSYDCRQFVNENGEKMSFALQDDVFVAEGNGQIDVDCHR